MRSSSRILIGISSGEESDEVGESSVPLPKPPAPPAPETRESAGDEDDAVSKPSVRKYRRHRSRNEKHDADSGNPKPASKPRNAVSGVQPPGRQTGRQTGRQAYIDGSGAYLHICIFASSRSSRGD
eukprot:GHVU01106031.1.p2 GENE.GHVU01106031.1~~GHVU01106031.1.p2  ORF type:complete len:126 (-),score=14.97 GHVU01106031.1:237-614(-)